MIYVSDSIEKQCKSKCCQHCIWLSLDDQAMLIFPRIQESIISVELFPRSIHMMNEYCLFVFKKKWFLTYLLSECKENANFRTTV